MRPLDLVCFDFWWTLFADRTPSPERHRVRVDALVAALGHGGAAPPRDSVSRLMIREWTRYNEIHLTEHRTPTNLERVEWMARQLGLEPPGPADMRELERTLDESLFARPPELVDGMADLLGGLAGHVRLALISDTSYSTGVTLRRLMDRVGILAHFDVLCFSDELGCAKPDPAVFAWTLKAAGVDPDRAVHIGDREETDIVGAKAASMRAVLFTGARPPGARPRAAATSADHVAETVDDLSRLLGVSA